jgi:hypothetical protein
MGLMFSANSRLSPRIWRDVHFRCFLNFSGKEVVSLIRKALHQGRHIFAALTVHYPWFHDHMNIPFLSKSGGLATFQLSLCMTSFTLLLHRLDSNRLWSGAEFRILKMWTWIGRTAADVNTNIQIFPIDNRWAPVSTLITGYRYCSQCMYRTIIALLTRAQYEGGTRPRQILQYIAVQIW